MHDWFNAKSASLLVGASQSRVSRQSLTTDNEPDGQAHGRDREEASSSNSEVDEYADEMSALHEAEDKQGATTNADSNASDEDEIALMETFATQTPTVRPDRQNGRISEDMDQDNEEETLREVTTDAPPIFRPVVFTGGKDLAASVKRRLRKGHEAILEEQPKWSLFAKVLKEIEDTITRVAESHAGVTEVSWNRTDRC